MERFRNRSSLDSTLRNLHYRLTFGKEYINKKYESLDYDVVENSIYLSRSRKANFRMYSYNAVRRYMNFALLGTIVGIIGAGITCSIQFIGHAKYTYLATMANECQMESECLWKLASWWIGLVVLIVFIGVFLATYIEPGAAGGGVSGVIAYLNGANIPRMLNAPVIVYKIISTVCTCVSGITGGKEGPMIHIGAVVGANLVKFPRLFTDGCCKAFYFDHEIRDLVAGGVAAGVAAAFNSPMGGLFLSIEESVSFLSVSLMFRIFIAAMFASWSASLIMSLHTSEPGNLSSPELLYMGQLLPEELSYTYAEIPLFILIGAIAGLVGASWVVIQRFATVTRRKYIGANKDLKMLDGIVAAILTGASHYLLSVHWQECRHFTSKYGEEGLTWDHPCPEGTKNDLTYFTLNTGEESLKWLVHESPESISIQTTGVLLLLYYVLAMQTTGISMALGIFVPNLLLGALWGRLLVCLMYKYSPDYASSVNAKKLIYVAAASQLCGTLRLTFGTVLTMMEVVGNNCMVLPLMVTMMTAKFVGDWFSPPQFEAQIILSGFPFLPPDAPPFSSETPISEAMNKSVVTLPARVSVRIAYQTLTDYTFGGFPLVRDGALVGFALRTDIYILLKYKVFMGTQFTLNELEHIFAKEFHRDTNEEISLNDADMDKRVDLEIIMNPTPYAIKANMSLSRTYKLFRQLGLRHLVVVDSEFKPIGIVTRKDLARYHSTTSGITALPIV